VLLEGKETELLKILIPIATTYKQGIYDVTQYTGLYITAKLITPDKPLTVMVGTGEISFSPF